MIEEPEVLYVNGLIDLEIQQWLETTGIFQIYNGIYADRPIHRWDYPLYDLPTQFVNCPRCWEINKGILDVSLLKIQQKDGGTFIFHLGDCSHCKQVIWFRHKLTPKTSEEFIFSPKYISPRIAKTARKQNATRKRHRIPVEHSTD